MRLSLHNLRFKKPTGHIGAVYRHLYYLVKPWNQPITCMLRNRNGADGFALCYLTGGSTVPTGAQREALAKHRQEGVGMAAPTSLWFEGTCLDRFISETALPRSITSVSTWSAARS